jgi:LysM repeat protein
MLAKSKNRPFLLLTVILLMAALLNSPATSMAQTETVNGLVTSTPNADGSVTHVVKDGESLWSIATAYGVSVEQIQNLNGMTSDFTVINIGQNLLIYAAGSLPTSTVVETVEAPVVETQVQNTVPVQRATATATLVKPVEDPAGTRTALVKALTIERPDTPVRKLTAGKIIGMIAVTVAGMLLLLLALNYTEIFDWVRARMKK